MDVDRSDAFEPSEIWRRRQISEFWHVGLSTVDRWVADSHPRLPPPRLDPGGRPFWIAAEVRTAALAPEPAGDPAAPSHRSPASQLSDEEAIAILRRETRRRPVRSR